MNISKNAFTALPSIESHSTLTTLDISGNQLISFDPSSLTNLTTLNVSDNQILTMTGVPARCSVTWGTQTKIMGSYGKNANYGFRIPTLLYHAGITTDQNASYSNVTWQVLDGTAYVEDNNKTAHKQSGAWENEYRFCDSQTESYVRGIYQCAVTP